MSDIKKMYSTILGDNFPMDMTISFGEQKLVYRKKTWAIPGADGNLEERGVRYGENPDQEAALYELASGNLQLGDCQFIEAGNGLVSSIKVEDMLQVGKHPGKINLTDIDNGLNIIKYLMKKPAAVILKHNNPCGAAWDTSLAIAFNRALRCDRIAAFGGAVIMNRPCDLETAALLAENYLEVVCAPDFEEGTLEILARRKNLRIIKIAGIDRLADYEKFRFIDFKSLIDGGIIVQQSPVNSIRSGDDLLPATTTRKGEDFACERQPTEQEVEDMIFGWAVEHGVTSNSVLYVKDGCTVGIGTGEQDRVGVAEIAVHKAYIKYADQLSFDRFGIPFSSLELEIAAGKQDAAVRDEILAKAKTDRAGLPGCVMISDAFFPFRDGADIGIEQGITAILQAGGSMRDDETIKACNEAEPQVAMMYTGQRSFKH
ncbi:bifunctional phospho ribosylaminoimidazole carboxamide formyltransferase/IMP cyclohydrolase [Desulfotalea psychrophila]|uniref:Related to bifunctional purine biosynthesis protein (PurH) n=1 Tax=Desulfotalea psychrophila (strain LSv54 / DSM 12343) TaxID=177439 RepID=Q6AMF5_DESPS|nr:bifunctional phospho ribosylaminoimidazole carboxamide formyltransferase/IMP cyclohydrolase [Desulfotalea psychrophila]CAG36470.1 related to bifunctional purine biosynthesis protein (PurH) [Desulfotalea psychrophila LSv54]